MATIPTFNTIPAANMAKPKYSNSASPEQKALREAFEKAIQAIKSDQAGTVSITPEMNARSIRMNLRHSADRLGLEVYGAVVTDKEVQYKVRAKQASNGAKAAEPVGATV